ncbi:hypothetical protein EBJ38_20530, partial [Escherichia coli]|nr:hypothetical protein [Escherichia coli]
WQEGCSDNIIYVNNINVILFKFTTIKGPDPLLTEFLPLYPANKGYKVLIKFTISSSNNLF